jgi:hypothetical protein
MSKGSRFLLSATPSNNSQLRCALKTEKPPKHFCAPAASRYYFISAFQVFPLSADL